MRIKDGTSDIYSVIKRHTGANASDTKPFKTAEVVEMVVAAARDLKVSSGERLAMLSALSTFGGTSLHPDIFQHPTLDKAMLSTAIMSGIGTSADFNHLDKNERASFLFDGVMIGGGDKVGMSKRDVETDLENFYEVDFGAASAPIAALVDANLKGFAQTHGGAALDEVQVTVTVIEHKNLWGTNEVYGYQVALSAPAKDGQGAFHSTDILANDGTSLRSVSNEFEPFVSE